MNIIIGILICVALVFFLYYEIKSLIQDIKKRKCKNNTSTDSGDKSSDKEDCHK